MSSVWVRVAQLKVSIWDLVIRGSPRESFLRKNSNRGGSRIWFSEMPSRLQREPVERLRMTHSIGSMVNE